MLEYLGLTLCMLGNFSFFLSSADIFQNQLFRKMCAGIPLVTISLYPDQACCFVGLDLDPICSQRLSADD